MPKEIQEVSQFITGTMTTPSERDIPPDAASFSLNIEPASEDGILQGVPEDSNLQYNDGSASDITVNVAKMATINNDGQRIWLHLMVLLIYLNKYLIFIQLQQMLVIYQLRLRFMKELLVWQ